MNAFTFRLALAACGLAGLAAAHAADADELRMLEQAKISLTQAIDAAERHQGGRAIEASLDDDSFQPAYEVSVVKDGRVYDVQVDGNSGQVLGAREDRDD